MMRAGADALLVGTELMERPERLGELKPILMSGFVLGLKKSRRIFARGHYTTSTWTLPMKRLSSIGAAT